MNAVLIASTVCLGVGTFGFRFAGASLKKKFRLSARVERVMLVAVVCLFAGLVLVAVRSLKGVALPVSHDQRALRWQGSSPGVRRRSSWLWWERLPSPRV